MNDLLTAREVAQRLRVEVSTVRRWVKTGAIESVILPQVSRRQGYRFKRETIARIVSGYNDMAKLIGEETLEC